MKEPIKHLLRPKEFRVWCRPHNVPSAEMVTTTLPSQAGCANCLTAFRRTTTGRKSEFKVRHTPRKDTYN